MNPFWVVQHAASTSGFLTQGVGSALDYSPGTFDHGLMREIMKSQSNPQLKYELHLQKMRMYEQMISPDYPGAPRAPGPSLSKPKRKTFVEELRESVSNWLKDAMPFARKLDEV